MFLNTLLLTLVLQTQPNPLIVHSLILQTQPNPLTAHSQLPCTQPNSDSLPNLHSFHQEDIDTVIAVFKGRTITVKLKTGEAYTYQQKQWVKGYDYRNPFAPKIEDATGLLDRTFTKVEIPPSFPGGESAWNKYVRKFCGDNQNIINDQGPATVYVQFIVGFDGTVDNVSAIRMNQQPPKELTDLAIRMIKDGPDWQPATQNGYKVSAYTRVKIDFK